MNWQYSLGTKCWLGYHYYVIKQKPCFFEYKCKSAPEIAKENETIIQYPDVYNKFDHKYFSVLPKPKGDTCLIFKIK